MWGKVDEKGQERLQERIVEETAEMGKICPSRFEYWTKTWEYITLHIRES
jgi:hypothetical protein